MEAGCGSEQAVLPHTRKQKRTDANTPPARFCSKSSKNLERMRYIRDIATCQRAKSALGSYKHF